jgi:DDE superfamily endonuclease
MLFRNRKGYLSQNVLGACTFDLQFSYIYPGWEGSANDTRVLQDASFRGGFSIPEGKYYLADAGYPNNNSLFTLYRGTRYHLKEQYSASQKPNTKEELFNLRYSSLCNVIERIFGVLKRRFKCLATPPEYAFDIQVNLVFALTALYNFIRIQNGEFDIFKELDGNLDSNSKEEDEVNNALEGKDRLSNISTEMDNSVGRV